MTAAPTATAATAGSHQQARGGLRLRGLDLAAVRRFHIYADVLLVSAAWFAAYSTRFFLNDTLGYVINESASYEAALPLIVPPWIASCWLFGIYQTTRLKTVIDQIQELLKGVLLGLLVISSLAFFLRELEVGRLVVLLTAAFSLANVPAASICCGFTGAGLPIGLQIAGRPFQEQTILNVSYAYEQAHEWRNRKPTI